MRLWRFYPVEGYPNDGIVIPPEGKAFIARFLTPEKAREMARKLREREVN